MSADASPAADHSPVSKQSRLDIDLVKPGEVGHTEADVANVIVDIFDTFRYLIVHVRSRPLSVHYACGATRLGSLNWPRRNHPDGYDTEIDETNLQALSGILRIK